MIEQPHYGLGDITHPSNNRDIIIGMNTTFHDVRRIGRRFVQSRTEPLALGSVLTFKFDEARDLHMLICHTMKPNNWTDAHKHVRFGLDFLWNLHGTSRQFSIVQIGTGRNGIRGGAESDRINRAISNSFLDMKLFVNYEEPAEAVAQAEVIPLRPFQAWNAAEGVQQLAA